MKVEFYKALIILREFFHYILADPKEEQDEETMTGW